MPIITVPKSLREKLGEEGSDALIEMFNQTQDSQKENIIEIVEEKFGLRLSEEISGLRTELTKDNISLRIELKEEIVSLRTELNEDIASLRTELKEDIASLDTNMHTIRADLIKWMFLFWVGQVVTILGILFVFFGE